MWVIDSKKKSNEGYTKFFLLFQIKILAMQTLPFHVHFVQESITVGDTGGGMLNPDT